jgi:ABC-type transport system involved in cytochrome c biogenesis permease subunit
MWRPDYYFSALRCMPLRGVMIKNNLIALLVFIALSFTSLAHASSEFNFDAFSKMPIVHEGRVKPLGRAAQLTLHQASGVKAPIKESTAWFASVLFDPLGAETTPIFHIDDKHIVHVLKLEQRSSAFYSFQELNTAFIKQSDLILSLRQNESLSDDQQALLELYAAVTYFEQIKGALTLVLPLKDGSKTFLDLPQKSKIAQTLLAQGQNNQSLRIIPITKDQHLSWYAPWEVIIQSLSNPDSNALLDQWHSLAKAYITNDAVQWNATTQKLYDETLTQTHHNFLPYQLTTELAYNGFQPYLWSLSFYAVGLLLALTTQRNATPFIGIGLAFHGIGLICRMIILQRPPVTDLYESMLFVGAMIVASTLLYSWRNKDKTIMVLGTTLGVILHIIGFAMNDGLDTLKVLQAVLDTKFWLATHVIIITTGYAFCLITSAFAHYCLYKFPVSRPAFKRLYILTLSSLLLICTGTLLGGVWADQSWGRFWGWDPKENGALLIGVWLVWLLHGKVTRHINEFYFIAGLVCLSMIVALSWIGINLLGVGLHSYGFINGSISSLIILFVMEATFLAVCFKRNHRNAL